MRGNGRGGKRRARGEEGERFGSPAGEDEVVASEAANEDDDVSVGTGWGGVQWMVHLLLGLLGYHNHLPVSLFSLIQPLTRGGGGVAV